MRIIFPPIEIELPRGFLIINALLSKTNEVRRVGGQGEGKEGRVQGEGKEG